MMKIQLDRENTIPLYLQIVNQLKRQIMSGEIPAGYQLPSERRLAESLGVNRTTVLNAYRELKAENLIGSHVGKGTVALPVAVDESMKNEARQRPIWNHFFSSYSNRSTGHVVNDLLCLANRKDVISFATGIASPECGPNLALAEIEEELVRERSFRLLLHSPVAGYASLRKAIASSMERKGCFCRPEEVMLLSGSQQGIDLTARIFIDPGDIVFMEEPTFFPALDVFCRAGARIVAMPIDRDGIKMDVLETLLQRYHPKLIYTIPSFHNPTGIEMSIERRKRLLELIDQYKVPTIEDDAYGDLCYDGLPLPTLKSMDHTGFVIYLNTFSKTIYPGLRIGWTIADKRVIDRFCGVRQMIDLHTNCLSQQIIERFLTAGQLDIHLKQICQEYGKRRDLMYSALIQYAPKEMVFDRPRGGYYIWCRLPAGVSEADLVKKAAAYGVVFLPGASSFPVQPADSYIRLNFTFAPKGEIEKGIRALCQAITELMVSAEQMSVERLIDLNPIV